MRRWTGLAVLVVVLASLGVGVVSAYRRRNPYPGENTRQRGHGGSTTQAAIGCDGILGSGLKLDKCGVCGGTNTQCEVMSGLFTSNSMGHGYHTIATIPTGAMYINVTELTKSRNYLALDGSNGNKYINMDWKIDAPGNYSIAGTFFIYKRSPGRTGVGEQLLADGPTTEDLNLILITQQKNPGISYEYSVPHDVPEDEVGRPSVSRVPQSVAPQRGQVNTRQDAPPSKSKVSGGVSLSTLLSAAQPAPVFPSTGSKRNPPQSPAESPALPAQEEGTGFGPQGTETDPGNRQQSDGHQDADQGADDLSSDAQPGKGHQGRDRGHQRGDGHHGGHHQSGGQKDGGQSETGDRPSSDRLEEPQADSAAPMYPAFPLRGVETQARGLPDSVYQQTMSSREQAGTGVPSQGQSSPPQGPDPMYPTQGDGVNPGRGGSARQPPFGGSRRGYIPPNANPNNPYPGRHQTYNPDPAHNPNPYYPNGNPYSNPNPNPNPYPHRNPYPNQNPYPSSNQRLYPNTNPNANPYRNPNSNPNPHNPYPSQYPSHYASNQETPGRQPSPPQPFLEIDPIESHQGSSIPGSSDVSALESGGIGSRDSQARYGWIDIGLTECSASCAGGIQHTKIDCIEWRSFRSQDPSLCDGLRRPSMRQQNCNTEACPPLWEVTDWMECSHTCGTGHQMRQVSCKQTLTQTLTTLVPIERCDARLKPDRVQECHNEPCTSWRAGNWGECNVVCGEGRRQREVDCVSDTQEVLEESACADKQLGKPRAEETCETGPCVSNWFVSEWNDLCSAECGGGHKSRYVVCTTEGSSNVLSDEACNTITKPRTSRTCNNMPCGAIWLTSEWSQCSRECGDGTQNRMVLCAGADNPHIIVNEAQCSMKPKPSNRQSCRLKDCSAMWFNSDWTQCSRTCGGGQRKREVKCLDTNMDPSTQCSEESRPSAVQACNIQQCTTNIPPASNCQDKFPFCEKVGKARLCTYMYYRNNCCFSCFNHQR